MLSNVVKSALLLFDGISCLLLELGICVLSFLILARLSPFLNLFRTILQVVTLNRGILRLCELAYEVQDHKHD